MKNSHPNAFFAKHSWPAHSAQTLERGFSLFAWVCLIAVVYINSNNVSKERRDAAFDCSKFYFVVPVNTEENAAMKR